MSRTWWNRRKSSLRSRKSATRFYNKHGYGPLDIGTHHQYDHRPIHQKAMSRGASVISKWRKRKRRY